VTICYGLRLENSLHRAGFTWARTDALFKHEGIFPPQSSQKAIVQAHFTVPTTEIPTPDLELARELVPGIRQPKEVREVIAIGATVPRENEACYFINAPQAAGAFNSPCWIVKRKHWMGLSVRELDPAHNNLPLYYFLGFTDT
jgi:hypothetical protein